MEQLGNNKYGNNGKKLDGHMNDYLTDYLTC